jgi:hypothetical protein
MLTTRETIQCAPIASAGFALSAGSFIANVAEALPMPDFIPTNGVGVLLLGGAIAFAGRMAESTLAGDSIRKYGLTPSKIDTRRAKRIANVVIGDEAYQLNDGRWKPRVWTDYGGVVIVKGSIVENSDMSTRNS